MRRPQRYTSFAPAYDALSGERPVYRAGRVAGIGALRLRPGALVLDIGCGTGLSFPLIREAVGPAGRIVGVDANASMLAQARAKVGAMGVGEHRPGMRGRDHPAPWLAQRASQAGPQTGRRRGRPVHLLTVRHDELAQSVAFGYCRGPTRSTGHHRRHGTPTGPATAFSPLAHLARLLGGSDITAHPWTALEQECTDVQAWSLRGGHIQVRAGTLRQP